MRFGVCWSSFLADSNEGSTTSVSPARLERLELILSDPVSCQLTGKNTGGMKQAWGHGHRLLPVPLHWCKASCYGVKVIVWTVYNALRNEKSSSLMEIIPMRWGSPLSWPV